MRAIDTTEGAMPHHVKPGLLSRTVNIAVVGTGGTGSQVLTGLARLNRALVGLGHPGGLEVVAYDPDGISEANVGRQLFYDADIGFNKAEVLIHRLNIAFGLSWCAEPTAFSSNNVNRCDIVLGCVDTAKARRDIEMACQQVGAFYWLDFGNRANDAQCVLGETRHGASKDWYMRLPTVMELFPTLRDPTIDEVDNGPSCSLAEALERQELYVNQMIATVGLNMLWQLFRHGEIAYSASFINLTSGSVTSLPINRNIWRRFGFRGARKPRRSATGAAKSHSS